MNAQAMIVAKVVDKNGPELASEVLNNSKEIQGQLKLTQFDTASMTAGMGITDSAAKKMRSAMNKRKGWNMLASHRQVKKMRVSQLPFGKEAWLLDPIGSLDILGILSVCVCVFVC